MISSGRVIKFFGILSGLQFLFAVFLFDTSKAKLNFHAVIGMGLGLYVFWIMLGGFLMYQSRDKIRDWFTKIPLAWPVKFFAFATVLALVEEAITTTLSNLAPMFGAKIGQAYITASTNYWDVVLGHSVIVFIPAFIAWAYLLKRYKFTPNEVFLLFGIWGTLAEMINGGAGHIAEIGMWMFVYGLMVWLPAYCIPQTREGKKVSVKQYFMAVILPFAAQIILVIFLPLIHHLRPSTKSNFPPN